ncbi:MAG: LacI family DNA-binding transcriptional regulator [Lachnospiraceae bacterium]|nr:LacI family DNA-binding transcriptional regulator [Lachnospiraceae bacterium]
MKNDNNNIKTIGVIMEDSYTDFAMEILHSIVHAIMGRKDIRLIIVSGRQDESDDMENREHLYKLTYNSIYRINAMCSFDGLIFTQPEFVGVSDDLFMDVPKVYIASDKKDEITVNYDNEMGIREAIDYLVRVKGFTRICMIGGRDDCADARIRKEIFRKCLEENGISYSEKLYVKADMSPDTQGPAAALLAMNPDVQAIFCVNDPTAMGLYDVMRAKGLIPGKDIAVFGFDNANIAGEMIPPLASIGTDGVTLGKGRWRYCLR